MPQKIVENVQNNFFNFSGNISEETHCPVCFKICDVENLTLHLIEFHLEYDKTTSILKSNQLFCRISSGKSQCLICLEEFPQLTQSHLNHFYCQLCKFATFDIGTTHKPRGQYFRFWSNFGQITVKFRSNFGQILVKFRSNFGQISVNFRSIFG